MPRPDVIADTDGVNETRASDTLLAVRNALMLGASLAATWSVALVVRLILPRMMGPERFGQFNFADTFTMTCGVAFALGIDTYIQKEIPARPSHANDILGGTLALRTAMLFGVLLGQEVFLRLNHKSDELARACLIFGAAQLASSNGNTFATLLQATRTVGRLAIWNVVSKVLWAGGSIVAMIAGGRLEGLALAFLISETVRAIGLWRIVRKDLGTTLAIDREATKKALRESLPFYVNAAAIIVYAKIDVTIMAMQLPDDEVGWYGTAWGFAGIAMLLTPLLGAVLMPQLARAAARSHEELYAMYRRSLELLLVMAIPVSLMMGLGADFVISTVFGAKFVPAIPALEILAPMFVLTYVAILSATCLVLTGRGWTTTTISLSSIAANAALNVFLLRAGQKWLGTGGGGTTAAAISVATEVLVVIAMLAAIGGNVFDKRSLATVAKCLFGCAVAVGTHLALARLGPLRLIVDAVAYSAIVIATRAVRPGELLGTLKEAWSSRRARS